MAISIARRLVDGVWHTGPVTEDSGGGDPTLLPRSEYRGISDFISAGVNTPITWVLGPDTGFALLDLADPTAPTVPEDGIYAVTALIRLSGMPGDAALPDRVGKYAKVSLWGDYSNFGWWAATIFPLDAGTVSGTGAFNTPAVGPQGSATLTNFVPQGGSFAVEINQDTAGPLRFEHVIAVQQVA